MTIAWQDIATAVIILAALVYLVRRTVRSIRRKGMPVCGGGCCSAQCPSGASEPNQNRLITIENRPKQ